MSDRLISADKLIQAIHNDWDDVLVWDESGEITATEFERLVFEQSTVDAELVRHGHWIEHHEPYTWMGYTYWSCSECGFECGYKKDIKFTTNYCPNCGARMDMEEKDA